MMPFPSASELEGVCSALEGRFLETARALEALNQQSEQFVRDSARLVSIAAGQVGGSEVYLGSRQTVEPRLAFLTTYQAEEVQLLNRLRHDCERIAQLLSAKDDLQRTMAPLKFMQTLFKVESAPLGEDVQLMFSALTRDIETMHSQVGDLFGTKFMELRQIQHTIEQVIEKLERQAQTMWGVIAKEKEQIDVSLNNLQKELLANERREARIIRLSTQIEREIQQVVTGLQFQDIINQKLQHTAEALAQIESKRDGNDGQTLHFLAQSCQLEAEQLQSVRNDLANAEQTVTQGIRNVMEHLSEADTECLSLAEFDQLTTSADGIVQTLLDVIDGVRKQIGAVVSNSADVRETLNPIRSLASGLTGIVRDLSQRIHLIGLNAQVQAAQVGEGTGLEVLSARTSEISTETNRVSQTIATGLDNLAENLARSVTEFEQLHTQALEHQRELSVHGGTQEQALHGLRDEALSTLHRIHGLLNEIQAETKQSLDNVDYIDTADEALVTLQSELRTVAENASRRLGADERKPANLVYEFQRKYTMASEHQVFASVVAGSKNGLSGNTVPGLIQNSDIEFFDDFSGEVNGDKAKNLLAGTTKPTVTLVTATESAAQQLESVSPASVTKAISQSSTPDPASHTGK